MKFSLIFFILSCSILALTIVNLSIGPNINGKNDDWNSQNCPILSDELSDAKEKEEPQEELEKKEGKVNECRNKKAMYNMEYASFIINAIISFISTLLGLYNLQKESVPRTGIMGMVLGIIGFILTFVYVVLNGIVYTNYYDTKIYKRESDGSVAELVEGETNKYKCLFFNKENDTEALYAKYSDLIKSQYNYNRELTIYFNEDYPEKKNCDIRGYYDMEPYRCDREEFLNISRNYTDKDGVEQKCEKLYYLYETSKAIAFNNYSNYDKSARFLGCLILCLFTLLCYGGMVFSGFMIFKKRSGESNAPNA